MIIACVNPAKYIGNTDKKCPAGEIIGILWSDKQYSWTTEEIQAKANFIDKMKLDPSVKLSLFVGDVVEPTDGANNFENLRDNVREKTGESIPMLKVKKAKTSPMYEGSLHKMFNDGRAGYIIIVRGNCMDLFYNESTGMYEMLEAQAWSEGNMTTTDAVQKAGLDIDLKNWIFEKKSIGRVFDLMGNSNSDYYITKDFYASQATDTFVQDGAAGSTFEVKIQTFEGVPVSGFVQADLLDVTADGVSVLGDVTGFAETTEGSGVYTVTTGTTFAAGSYAVTLKAEVDLSTVGFGFRNATAGTLS